MPKLIDIAPPAVAPDSSGHCGRLSDLMAEPGFAPRAWQIAAPPEVFGRSEPVGGSPDLDRVLALPRRPKLDLASPRAQAMVDLMTSRYSNGRPAGAGCACREIDPQRKTPCITRLLPVQAWSLYEMSIAKGLLGAVPVGGGKCSAKSSEFLDYSTGRRRSVAEPGGVELATYDRTLRVASANAFPSGQKPCVRFVLADGSYGEFSTDHKVLTHRGWIETSKLLPESDFVSVAVEMPDTSITEATDHEVKLVAYMLSDGGCSQSIMTFTNMTPEIIAEWQGLADQLCGGFTIAKEPGERSNKAGFYRLRNNDRSRAFRERWDLHGLAKGKRAHSSTWGLPRRQIALLLNRFWACDGHVSARGFEIVLASQKLIDDVRFWCSRLGVRTRKRYKLASYVDDTGTRRKFDSWRVTVNGADALRFLDEVGDVFGKEYRCRQLRSKLEGSRRNTNTDLVPIGEREMHEICDELGYPRRHEPNRGLQRLRSRVFRSLGVTHGQYISRRRFLEFCREFGYAGRYVHLATTDTAWERVVSVEDIGVQDVYDVSVPTTHNFVANGIVVHNTIIGLLGVLALEVPTALLLVPPNLISQLVDDYKLLSQHFRTPAIYVHDAVHERPQAYEGESILHVLPYSLLSQPNRSDIIERLQPHAIMSDECDKLKDLKSATTSRVMRYFAVHGDTRFCGWTGSITDKSILEYCHLLALSLRYASPLPLELKEAENWGRTLDAVPNPAPPGELLRLCEEGESVRSGYHRRLSETLGVIMVGESDVEVEGRPGVIVEQSIRERPAPVIPPKVLAALESVRNFVRPDGEELVDALSVAKSVFEVACGFYYYWEYPRGEPESLIKEWLAARKDYHKELRRKLFDRHEFLDSQKLCEDAAKRAWGDLPKKNHLDGTPYPEWKAVSWPRWRDVKNLVKPRSKAERLDDYLARDAAQWAHENRGIVWYTMVEFGQLVAELSGLPLHTGGPKAPKRIKEENGSRSIIASVNSHGRGRNGLQYVFNRQLIANVFPSARRMQQLLGRIHRRGQGKDDVVTDIYVHTPEFRKAIGQLLRRSRYVEETTVETQKFLVGWEGEDYANQADGEEEFPGFGE